MRRTLIKAAILVGVFFAALIIISTYGNQGNTDMTNEMSDAIFPIVSMYVGEFKVNRMHGYAEAMEPAYLRNTLIPVESDRKVSFEMNTYGTELEQLSFEVRSLDGERLVESTEITDYEQVGRHINFSITMKDLIDADTEYMLIVIAKPVEAEPIRYYSRMIQTEKLNIYEKLSYVKDFHEKTFDKEQAKELTKYLESNAEGDNSTFQTVNIHSNLNQVTWGDLPVTKVTEPIIMIRELSEQTGSFGVEYLVSVKDGKNDYYYTVKEYYRIKYTPDRTYLLDFERQMNQLFDEEGDVFVNDKIMLGIVGDDVALVESDGGNVFAYVVGNKLYSYNVTDHKLARIFSFYDNMEKVLDERCVYDEYEIQILNVDETGNVSFTVYGYMNRGRHEGQVGVSLYQYNSMTNTVEEMVYLPYHKSPDMLKADLRKLSYLNKAGFYYLLLEDCIYCVDLESMTSEIITDGLLSGTVYVSPSNTMVTWQNGENSYSGTELTLMNLNSKKKSVIRAGIDEYISVLGYMDDDLIYGLAKRDDILMNSMGAVTFPMYCVKIQDDNDDVLKTYQEDGIYVVGSEISDNQITLFRVAKNGSEGYRELLSDQIMSAEKVKTGINLLSRVVTENYETIVQIDIKEDINLKAMKHLTPKEVLFEGSRTIELAQNDVQHDLFYVYGKDGLEQIYSNAGKAVQHAYRIAGVVVNDHGDYVWQKTGRVTRNQIMAITEESFDERNTSLAVCLNTLLKYEGVSRSTQSMLVRGDSVIDIMKQNLQNDTILDLTGCSLDAVLYYVNMDIPVLATLKDGNAVLIIGFNELNTVLMDPISGSIYKKGMNDSKEWFEENGNQFITYKRNE